MPNQEQASPARRLDVALIAQRMQARGLSAADVARHCGVSREAVSSWLSGEFVPRARSVFRLCMLLELAHHELLGLPDPATLPPEEVCIQLGRPWRVSKAYAERALDDAGQLHTLHTFLPPPSPFARAVVLEPSLRQAHLEAVACAARTQLGPATRTTLHASDFVVLLRRLGVHLGISLLAEKDSEYWTQVVHLPQRAGRLFVYVPLDAPPAVRLRGLAEAYGVCLSLGKLSAEEARRYGRALADRLLSAGSLDDVGPALDSTSARRLVDSARQAGLGDLFDAVQAFQVHEGCRNHAFASHTLRACLGAAYAFTAELMPSVRQRLERQKAQAAEEARAA